MKVIIDAYNLFHWAQARVEPPGSLILSSLVQIVGQWATATDSDVLMVFDGKVPPTVDVNALSTGHLHMHFVGPEMTADDAIIEVIDTYSAPKSLCVVSTDREIRRAAKRRRCKGYVCEDFWPQVVNTLANRPVRREPKEKRAGLTPEQTEYWLKQFGLK